jgi:ABC-type glycerol-3-phosphate transport system substrate-binding protein
MMKRLVQAAAIAVLVAALFAACGGKNVAAVKEDTTGKTPDELLRQAYPSTVTVHTVLAYREPENPNTPKSLTPENNSMLKHIKERLNIELVYDWIVNSDQFSAKFGAEIAAGNLPDIMYLTPTQFDDLAQQGGLADLTEIYEKYANDRIKSICDYDGKLLEAVKRNGKLYGLPQGKYPGQQTSQTYYRMDYLRKAGITRADQLPKTIAEFEVLCNKLMKVDFRGDGVVGGPVLPGNMQLSDAGLADFSPVFHAYGASPNVGFVDDGTGKLTYSGLLPEMEGALKKLREWYAKGYFAKDFASGDVFAAHAPVVAEIIAGKYPIIFGSWWIPNWPLNLNKANQSEAEWVIGPTLTVDGTQPPIFVDRYFLDHVVAVSKKCKNPEAIFKMMNLSRELVDQWNQPGWDARATPEELNDKLSYVYLWLPYRTFSPGTTVTNQQYIAGLEREGRTTPETIGDLADAPLNDEFYNVLTAYISWHAGDHSGPTWGTYFSRVADNGGVANMYRLYSSAPRRYDEVYINTPSMVAYKSELDRLQQTALIQMIMGDQSEDYFATYKSRWLAQGGQQILNEVNEWFANAR